MTSGPLLAIIVAMTVAAAPPSSDTNASDTSPDAIADYAGGIATQLRDPGGAPVQGHLFLLMATAGSDAPARLFDDTPYTHENGAPADAIESNVAAAETAETITGIDVDRLDLTTAPGGGASGGLIYAIAYLNIISDGEFTGDLRVAATGQLEPDGYIGRIDAINEKTAAAHLAHADVLFSPSAPTSVQIEEHGARLVGELFRARNTGSTLDEERRLGSYRKSGAERPEGMDIVGTRHIADVAAYLCGAGSNYACGILEILGDNVIGGPSLSVDLEPAHASTTADVR